jgi:hypothetical protein
MILCNIVFLVQGELCDQGELLMQGSFSVWMDSKKDRLRELRLKPMQRHIFLYQKAMLFCKKAAKEVHNKDTYHFKRYLKVSYTNWHAWFQGL